MKRMMVFSPHPDDDIIGCGGTMAKYAGKDYEITVVYLSSGEAGSVVHSKKDLAAIRETEAIQATRLLGIEDIHFLRNPDGYIEFNRENLVAIVNLLREKRPLTVFIPHSQDGIHDHLVCHQLVTEACNRAAGPWFQECQGEPWSVSNLLGYEVWTPLQTPSHVEDISRFMDTKLAALQQHVSQLDPIRYDEAIQGLNRYRGIMTGRGDYCECFEILKANLSITDG